MSYIKLSEHTGYFPGAVNIGFIQNHDRIVLIDTGLDKNSASRVYNELQNEGLTVEAIITTHAHADHYGGNSWFILKFGTPIIASIGEKPFLENPFIEPMYLNAGAIPPAQFNNKFLLGNASPVAETIVKNQNHISLLELDIEVIHLPGHAIDMIGVQLEGVFFCADSLFSTAIIEKHGIPFFIDCKKQRETLNFIDNSLWKWIIPSHGEPAQDSNEMVGFYLDRLIAIESDIVSVAGNGLAEQNIVAEVSRHFAKPITSLQQYALMRTPIISMLQDMEARGLMKQTFENGSPYWKENV